MATNIEPAIGPGNQPAREHRTLPLENIEWRKSGSGEPELTIRGHASVFNRLSLDLGGFRERIAPGAFTETLDNNPDVHALWDHDTRLVLARTKNKTLDLREDPIGLHFWAKVADTSYARDLRILMERGDVDQASFAFTVPEGGDEWNIREEDGQEIVERTINKIDQLYDVTVTAMGAYPQTDTSVVKHMRSRIEAEINEGHLPETAARALPKIVASDDPADETTSQSDLGVDNERNPAPKVEVNGIDVSAAVKTVTVEDNSAHLVAEEKRAEGLKQLQSHTRTELELAKRRLLDAERKRK